MTQPPPSALDLAQTARMVDAALDAAQISAGDRARLACAKTLLRLQPPPGAPVKPENFAAALQALGGGDSHD